MYLPKHHEVTDTAALHELIKAHPLGLWVTTSDGELVANHVPVLLQPERGAHGTLVCHVARANPVWRQFSTTQRSIVSFQGADAYITPSWYPSKQAHGKAVPTWNYVVVHAHGIPRAIEDKDWLLSHVTALTKANEAGQPAPWRVTDAPADYIDRMLTMIVGIEIPIATLVGKWKVSQNRPEEDRLGVLTGLQGRARPHDETMAGLIGSTMSAK